MKPSGNLELSTLAALAGERAPYRRSQGDVIFRQGDVGDKPYGVVSGQVQRRWRRSLGGSGAPQARHRGSKNPWLIVDHGARPLAQG